MTFRCAKKWAALLVIALNTQLLQANAAETAQTLVEQLRSAGAVDPDASVSVLTLPDETIVIVNAERADEPSLRKTAGQIAQALSSDQVVHGKPLKVVCCDQAHGARSLTLSADQLNAGAANTVAVFVGEQAVGARVAAAQVAASVSGSGTFQSQRVKLVERIKALEGKGVGVKPFFDEVSRIDGLYSHGDTAGATAALGRLGSTVAEHEQIIKTKSVVAARPAGAPAAAAAAAAPMSSAKQAAMQQMLSQMRAQGASQKQIDTALTNFQGTSDEYYDEIARTMLQHELGDLAPCEGPFRMERFRIAKKIQELRVTSVNTAGFTSFYRKLEEMAVIAAKDPRKIAEMADNVRYMEKQLGLSELQGGSHRRQ